MNKNEYNEAFDDGFNFAVAEIQKVTSGASIQARQVLESLILHLTSKNASKSPVGPQIEDLQAQIKRLEAIVRRLDRKAMEK